MHLEHQYKDIFAFETFKFLAFSPPLPALTHGSRSNAAAVVAHKDHGKHSVVFSPLLFSKLVERASVLKSSLSSQNGECKAFNVVT